MWSNSRHRSRTDDTEGPIGGISENEPGNDIDRHCSLIEDRVIVRTSLKHFYSWLIWFATLPIGGLPGNPRSRIRPLFSGLLADRFHLLLQRHPAVITIAHTTILRWVIRYAETCEKRWRLRAVSRRQLARR
jgi:hypothetical protein